MLSGYTVLEDSRSKISPLLTPRLSKCVKVPYVPSLVVAHGVRPTDLVEDPHRNTQSGNPVKTKRDRLGP